MKPLPSLSVVLVCGPLMAHAEWCDPPQAPMLTTLEQAREFREEFKDEFDQYFRNAAAYAECLDAERARVFIEMQNTTKRYEHFLNESKIWGDTNQNGN